MVLNKGIASFPRGVWGFPDWGQPCRWYMPMWLTTVKKIQDSQTGVSFPGWQQLRWVGLTESSRFCVTEQGEKWKWRLLSRVRLFESMDCCPPGSSVHGILQARIPEWVGLSCPSLGDLPNLGIEPRSPRLHADSLLFELLGRPDRQEIWKLVFVFLQFHHLHFPPSAFPPLLTERLIYLL